MNTEKRKKELGLPRLEKPVIPFSWDWQQHENYGHTTDRAPKDYQMEEMRPQRYESYDLANPPEDYE